MIQFIQPGITLVLGLSLAVYGLIHSSTHYPGDDNLRALWQSLPALTAVLMFLLGLLAVTFGLLLLTSGIQGIRRRIRQIDHAFGSIRRDVDPYDDDDSYRPRAYR